MTDKRKAGKDEFSLPISKINKANLESEQDNNFVILNIERTSPL